MVSRIHDLGIGGAALPWDDALHDGPVPEGALPAELCGRRAGFLAEGDADEAREVK
jgi:hypothetical protein